MKQMLPNPVLDALAESQSHEEVLAEFRRHISRQGAYETAGLSGADLSKALAEIKKGKKANEHLTDDALMQKLSRAQASREAMLGVTEQSRAFIDWYQKLVKSGERLRIERPSASRFHDLIQAIRQARLFTDTKDSGMAELLPELFQHAADFQVFLVTHDWAGAFARAEGMRSEDCVLPFDRCAFEFQIGGRRFIMCTSTKEAGPPTVGWAVQFDGWWSDLSVPLGDEEFSEKPPLSRCLWENLQGLCIALDAEIATATMIRQPYRLNAARQKAGKLPLYDYRVLDLKRRHGQADEPAPDNDDERQSPRLHFRRGHFRHFSTYKTWVRWCLVGDPDLGFIEKEYRA